ncbi:MAG: Nif3-like dinuclear metal center hexameric protein, partial [Saprospiraceae bacterium]
NQASGTIGAGIVGYLETAMPEMQFLEWLKDKMQASCIRHTAILGNNIQKIAVCGGSGQFLLQQAISAGADAYISADFKYHEFFDADGQILVADIGHFESEQFTISLLYELITKKFNNFAVRLTELNTNPIHYI